MPNVVVVRQQILEVVADDLALVRRAGRAQRHGKGNRTPEGRGEPCLIVMKLMLALGGNHPGADPLAVHPQAEGTGFSGAPHHHASLLLLLRSAAMKSRLMAASTAER